MEEKIWTASAVYDLTCVCLYVAAWFYCCYKFAGLFV